MIRKRFTSRDILVLIALALLLASAKVIIVSKTLDWKNSKLTESRQLTARRL